MANYITIDGGTTNTRISLVCDGKIIDTKKYNIGAKVGITNNSGLKEAVKNGITDIIAENKLTSANIHRILASGMITSEFGLYKLDHTNTPAGIPELHDTMKEVLLEDVSEIPFVFIRGIKMQGSGLESTDMMRGEETELAGLMHHGSGMYILPGSHSKVTAVDASGKITGFFTALTGEMILSLSQNTILQGSVDLGISAINEEYLLKGFDYCKKHGINEALFKTRVLDTIFKASREDLYSFYIGVILTNEVLRVAESNPQRITIGGKKQIKEALALILKNRTDAEIICLSDEEVEQCVSLGAVRIFEYRQ